MGAYENPITYVDTESAKYYAGAISQIGQVGAKLITDETQRRKKEAEENRIRNEKRQQRFKKIQLETQSNVNDALKTLDFSENESFRKGMGNIIDEYALAKSAYEFETDPAKSKELGNKIFKMDSFFKKSFGSEMDDLMADVEMYKKVQNNAGNEGGISKYMDSNYGTLLQYMANNTDPGNLEFEFDVDSGDVILVLSGKDENGEDLYTGPGVKDGVYKVSLKGNQSSELPIIPEVNLRKSNGKSKTGEKLPSALQNIGVYNASNQVPAQYYNKKVIETKLDNGNIITQFTFNDLGKSVIRKEIEAEVIGLLTSGEGPAQGVQSANLLYQNVLTNNETLDENGSFVLNGQNIPITKESFNSMVDKLTQREVDYVQNNMPIQTTKTSTDKPSETEIKRQNEKNMLKTLADDLLTFDSKSLRPGMVSGVGSKDIVPDELFQQELLKIGPGFTYKEIIKDGNKDFIPLKVIGAPDSDAVQIPLAGLTDVALKKAMYIIAGGKKTDDAYKKLGTEKEKETKDPYDIFARN
jgi:hypothetical protein